MNATTTTTIDADPLFQAVANLRLRRLAQRGSLRSYRRGTLLMAEGDKGDTLLVVLAGRLKAYSDGTSVNLVNGSLAHPPDAANSANTANTKNTKPKSAAMPREITYGVYGPGDLVGEMSLDDGPRSASVVTLEPTVCSVITRNTVRHFIGEEPEFAFDLLARVIARARRATYTTRSLVMTDAYGRLSELLTSIATPHHNGSFLVHDRITHQDIANRIGCSREMVSRLLKDLETGGYIEVDIKRRFLLKKALPARW